jgi:hypothetical protein
VPSPLNIIDGLDELTVTANTLTGSDPVVYMKVRNRDVGRTTSDDAVGDYVLNQQEARRLFNWLGVWLHGA